MFKFHGKLILVNKQERFYVHNINLIMVNNGETDGENSL